VFYFCGFVCTLGAPGHLRWLALLTALTYAASFGITVAPMAFAMTLLLPYASGTVIDYTIIQHSGSEGGASPMLLASGLFGLSALAGGGVYLRTLWLAQAGNRIVARLRQQLYERILQQESAYFDNPETTTGDLLSRLTADAQMVQSAVTTQAVSGLRGIVMSVGSAGMLLYTSPTLAAISCGTLPPIFILTRHLGRKLSKQQEQVQELLGDATTLAEQSLTSVMTVKQSVAEDFESVRYRNAIAAAHSKAVEIAHWQAQLEAGAHIAGNAAILGVLGYGGTLVLNNSLSAGDLTGFVMYSLLLAGNLSGLTSVYSDSVRAVAASNRIFEILDREPKIPSGKQQHSQKQKNLSTDQDDYDNDDDSTARATTGVARETTTTTTTTSSTTPNKISFEVDKNAYDMDHDDFEDIDWEDSSEMMDEVNRLISLVQTTYSSNKASSPAPLPTETTIAATATTTSITNEDTIRKAKKRRKKILKNLKSIRKLKEMKESGKIIDFNEEQRVKILKEQQLKEELESVEHNLQ